MKQVESYLPAMIQRVSIVAGWLGLAFIVYATLPPIDTRPVITQAHFEHFAAFALVGLAFGLGYQTACFWSSLSSREAPSDWRRYSC